MLFKVRLRASWCKVLRGGARSRVPLALVCAAGALALPAHAAAAESSSEKCANEKALYEIFAAYTPVTPVNGAEAQAHVPATFTAESQSPVTFDVASSEQGVSKADIDSGHGSAGAGSLATKYTFTSSRATAQAGTIYWAVAFTASLPDCGGESRTFFTPTRTLQVRPSPESAPTEWSPPTTSTSHLRVGISAANVLHVGRPTVSYSIECTSSCTGHTRVQAWLVRRHRKAARAATLDFGPRGVSITNPAGGHERFSKRYQGRALRQLRSMLRGNGQVKLEVTVTAKDASGDPATAHKVILLRR
jgi:hypothetical protein